MQLLTFPFLGATSQLFRSSVRVQPIRMIFFRRPVDRLHGEDPTAFRGHTDDRVARLQPAAPELFEESAHFREIGADKLEIQVHLGIGHGGRLVAAQPALVELGRAHPSVDRSGGGGVGGDTNGTCSCGG